MKVTTTDGYFQLILSTLIAGSLTSYSEAQSTSFDVDSRIEAIEIRAQDQAPPTQSKLIQIPIQVSTDFDAKSRKELAQIRVDVQFLESGNTVQDYSPRTVTYTDIEGPISYEKHREKNANLGVNLSGSYEPVRGSANVGLGQKNRTVERYQKLPEQKLLFATGTKNRRSGVYFKFLPSTQEASDAEKQIMIVAKVPQSWRIGLLRIQVEATGKRQLVPGFKEDYRIAAKSFDTVVFLSGDESALELASTFESVNRRVRNKISSDAHSNLVDSTLRDLRSIRFNNQPKFTTKDINRWLVRPSLSSDDQKKLKRLPSSERELYRSFISTRREILKLKLEAKPQGPSLTSMIKK